jgi:nicotinamide-nucleotide amidase
MYKAEDAEIITIGDEILIGQIVDTNSAWMAQQLNLQGINVRQISSVPDSEQEILSAIREAETRAGIILITGGLGPTNDDITKKTLCQYFGGRLVMNPEQLEQIEALFQSFGRTVTEVNQRQAEVPDTCTCLVNRVGTAPGMWFEQNDHIYVSMPGVPYEMKSLMEEQVLPRLREKIESPELVHRTFLTQGVGESVLAGWIEAWENSLPASMKLAYLPSPGQVRLRLTSRGKDAQQARHDMEVLAAQLYEQIGEHIYGEGETSLPEVVQQIMMKKGLSLSLAESCTGGNIAHMLTLVPGSSAYFKGGVVAYSNEIKSSMLGVSEQTLNEFGAVSKETVIEMARGAQDRFTSDYALAISGIAGPDGGTAEKPVGTVWIAVASKDGIQTKSFRFSRNRERNIAMASLSALHLLKKSIAA